METHYIIGYSVMIVVSSIGLNVILHQFIDNFMATKSFNPITLYKGILKKVFWENPLMRKPFQYVYIFLLTLPIWVFGILTMVISFRLLKPIIFRKE